MFTQKTLKLYSYELLHDLEVEMLTELEEGVKQNWANWEPLIKASIRETAQQTAAKNKRELDFLNFESFKINLNYSDPIDLIIDFSKKENERFKNYFKEKNSSSKLQAACGITYRFRNLVDHPAGKLIYLGDIKEFLRAARDICRLLRLSNYDAKLSIISNDIELSIFESSHHKKDEVDAVFNNLPRPDYLNWHGLVGRDSIKSDIIADLKRGNNRVIAIIGGGGIGKSALALNIGFELSKPTHSIFHHIVWITSKSNFLDYSGIKNAKTDFFYSNNYKDFLNQFLSGFFQKLHATNLDSITEQQLEKDANELFETYNRILLVVDNLENIDDPKILDFIKNKVIPPNFVLITSRKGLGEINKTYRLEPLDKDSALLLFENLCNFYSIDYKGINQKRLKEMLNKTHNYPLVIKWCLSLVSGKQIELEAAFAELDKPANVLLEFVFQKLYQQLSSNSKKILRALTLYKEIHDRNIISYIADLKSEEEISDAIYELEQYSLVKQQRADSKNGIVETLTLQGLVPTFINSLLSNDLESRKKIEVKIEEIDKEVSSLKNELIEDLRPAQRLAQSKLLQALKICSLHYFRKKEALELIGVAERVAPRFYLTPYYRALIELLASDYDYVTVRNLFEESISLYDRDSRVLNDYGKLIKKHRSESPLDYARIFAKAFEIDKKTGTGIDAALAYNRAEKFKEAHSIILNIKKTDSDFPQAQNQLWVTDVISRHSENCIMSDREKAYELLKSINNLWLDYLQTQNRAECKLLYAKYCSIHGLLKGLFGELEVAKSLCEKSDRIAQTYRSTQRNTYIMKEVICYNLLVEALCTENKNVALEKVSRIHNEFEINNSEMKDKLMTKFKSLINLVKK